MPCDAKTFRDSIVAGSKETAVGWANEYSPILDVTNTVKKVCPKVTKALLTIYGDDLSKIKVIKVGTVTPVLYPDGRPADISVYGEKAIWNILHNWLAGYEFERQTCEGVSYWVIYPCKLEVQGTLELPCVLSDFVGKDVTKDVTDIVRQYITQPRVTKATLTIYGSKPQKFVGIYDNIPDKYPDGRKADISKYGTDAAKNIVENWFMRQEWERIQCQRTGKWYWVLYPCKLEMETEEVKVERLAFKVSPGNPDLGSTATVSWTHTNGYSKGYKFGVRFLLVKPNGEQVQVFPSSGRYEYGLDPNKTKTGSFSFTVPKLPGKYTLIGTVDLYYSGRWVQDEKASYSWVVPGTEEPSVEDFVNALVQHHKSKTPTISVESKLKPNHEYLDSITIFGILLTYADDNYDSGGTLKLYLDKPNQISVEEYGWDMPPARYKDGREFCINVVKGWLEGYELMRMYSSKSGKWYWVKIPCDFSYNFEKATPILEVKNNQITYGYKGAFYSFGNWAEAGVALFIDGKLVDAFDVSYREWKDSTTKEFKKTISIPPLSTGYHTITVLYCDIREGKPYDKYGMGALSKQIYATAPAIDVKTALMLELKKWYTKTVEVPGVTEPYDWSFDVTETVRKSGLVGDVEKAYLYGWHRIESYTYAGTSRPPARSSQEIVSGWLNGYELALFPLNQKDYPNLKGSYGWYWVKVPAKLLVKKKIYWDVSVDRTTVAPGDTLTIIANINWESVSVQRFKLGIEAFGKSYETNPVEATVSPTRIEAPITVPLDVGEGEYEIKVTLYYE